MQEVVNALSAWKRQPAALVIAVGNITRFAAESSGLVRCWMLRTPQASRRCADHRLLQHIIAHTNRHWENTAGWNHTSGLGRLPEGPATLCNFFCLACLVARRLLCTGMHHLLMSHMQ